MIKSLDELASMHMPIELLHEMKVFAFRVIAHIFLGSISNSVIESMVKYYSYLFNGLMSPVINIPGFAFRRALKVKQFIYCLLEKFKQLSINFCFFFSRDKIFKQLSSNVILQNLVINLNYFPKQVLAVYFINDYKFKLQSFTKINKKNLLYI